MADEALLTIDELKRALRRMPAGLVVTRPMKFAGRKVLHWRLDWEAAERLWREGGGKIEELLTADEFGAVGGRRAVHPRVPAVGRRAAGGASVPGGRGGRGGTTDRRDQRCKFGTDGP